MVLMFESDLLRHIKQSIYFVPQMLCLSQARLLWFQKYKHTIKKKDDMSAMKKKLKAVSLFVHDVLLIVHVIVSNIHVFICTSTCLTLVLFLMIQMYIICTKEDWSPCGSSVRRFYR